MQHTVGASARLLERLRQAKGRVVPYSVLFMAMYSDEEPDNAAGCLRVLMHHMRKRLPAGAITVHRGVGLSLDPAVAATLPEVDARLLVPAEDVGR